MRENREKIIKNSKKSNEENISICKDDDFFMSRKGLSNDEKNKFSIFLKSWYNSQDQYTIGEIAEILNIPSSSLYDYIMYEKAPNSVEKANIIINFIKNNQIKKKSETSSNQNEQIKDVINESEGDAAFLCQINELNNSLNNLQSSLKIVQDQLSLKKKFPKKLKDNEIAQHIYNTNISLFLLYSELDWFKNSTDANRKEFRKNLSSKDIGYITSLLRAMIKGEDDFSDWLLATNYQMEMLKWQKSL